MRRSALELLGWDACHMLLFITIAVPAGAEMGILSGMASTASGQRSHAAARSAALLRWLRGTTVKQAPSGGTVER